MRAPFTVDAEFLDGEVGRENERARLLKTVSEWAVYSSWLEK